MGWINKDDITIGQLKSLCPTYGLLDGVNFDKKEYYQDDTTGNLFEISFCSDSSLSERVNTLKKVQKTKELMSSFGLAVF